MGNRFMCAFVLRSRSFFFAGLAHAAAGKVKAELHLGFVAAKVKGLFRRCEAQPAVVSVGAPICECVSALRRHVVNELLTQIGNY